MFQLPSDSKSCHSSWSLTQQTGLGLLNYCAFPGGINQASSLKGTRGRKDFQPGFNLWASPVSSFQYPVREGMAILISSFLMLAIPWTLELSQHFPGSQLWGTTHLVKSLLAPRELNFTYELPGSSCAEQYATVVPFLMKSQVLNLSQRHTFSNLLPSGTFVSTWSDLLFLCILVLISFLIN